MLIKGICKKKRRTTESSVCPPQHVEQQLGHGGPTEEVYATPLNNSDFI